MDKDHCIKFFNGSEYIDLLTEKNARGNDPSDKFIHPRTSGINLEEIRAQLQELHRSNMKVIS
ncbi:hypothetical protein J3L18_05340 [Mucilaginibacter gossypii]|uniref:hypothetical protein n=1 Tax=Mucilaginibacter gossypii TaxID=551996 RepID=UPI000DCC6A31|nr:MULTISPECIES: hypothetical protein [Mucilaginibacter]QTE38502.1 hypothetical protein J3L18_05340 [Mucilaginibacter gossypii]RAV55761.1 hypothetical protein DIU36_16855 [Mucilaginibacter rubeus]